MGTSTRSLQQTVYRHLKEFLAIAIYLWVVFGLLVMFKSVVLAEHHIPLAYHGFAVINALALAKVMFVAKKLHLGDRFDEAPLIYPTLFKSAVFTAVLACFKILEEIAIGLYHGQSFHQSIAELGGTWKAISIFTLLLFAILIPFVGYGELQRVLGEGKLGKIFFRPPTPLPD